MLRCRRGRDLGGPSTTDDAGVIAIVVALSVSTFMLGFAALAVDLGSAYVRKAELQSVANRLALAGAKGLPIVVQPEGAIDQIDQALSNICQTDAVPGVCTVDSDGNGSAPNRSWMTDGDPANGEVTFYSDPDGDTKYSLTDRVTDLALSSVATALRVKLAPSTVDFGLAAAIGTDSATLTKSASGRVGTPLGSGILPFALQPGDLTNGQFCVRDPAFPLNPTPGAPTPAPRAVTLTFPPGPGGGPQYPDDVPPETTGLFIDIKLTAPPSRRGNRLSQVKFHFTNSPGAVDGQPVGPPDDNVYRVPLPSGAPGETAQVWATGRERSFPTSINFTSDTGLIRYDGDLAPSADLCQQPSSERGFVQLARPGNNTDLENLERNIRSGPAVNLSPVDSLLGAAGDILNCVATDFAPATTCLSVLPGEEFEDALTLGMFSAAGSSPGRLIGDCGNGTMRSDPASGIDASQLFRSPGFINTSKGGSASALKDRLSGLSGPTAADPENQGWVTAHVLQCPRLAVMPVIDPNSSVGGNGGKEITGFTYVWIDDDVTSSGRGLHWTLGRLDSFRGYVVDPGYLPATVAGSKLIGPFLGGNMPKQVQLIPDLGGAAT